MNVELLSDYLIIDWLEHYKIIDKDTYAILLLEISEQIAGADDAHVLMDEDRPWWHFDIQTRLAKLCLQLIQTGNTGVGPIIDQILLAAEALIKGDFSEALSDDMFAEMFKQIEQHKEEKEEGVSYIWPIKVY